jgi:hypothetical protein
MGSSDASKNKASGHEPRGIGDLLPEEMERI